MLQIDQEAENWLRQHESELPSITLYDPFLTAIRNAVKRVTGKNSDKKIQNVLEDFNQLLSASGQGPAVSNIVSDYGDFIEMYFSYVLDGEKCKDIAPRYTIYRKGKQATLTPGQCRAWIAKIEKWVNALSSELKLTLEQKARFLGELREEISTQKKDAAWQRLFVPTPKPGVPTRNRGTGAWWENPDYEEPAPRKDWPTWLKATVGAILAGEDVPPAISAEAVKFLAGGNHWAQRPLTPPKFIAPQPLFSIDRNDPEYKQLLIWTQKHPIPKPETKNDPLPRPAVVPEIPEVLQKPAQIPDADDRRKTKYRQLECGLIALLDGPKKLPTAKRHKFVGVVDGFKAGKTIAQIAESLRMTEIAVSRAIKTLKKAADDNA